MFKKEVGTEFKVDSFWYKALYIATMMIKLKYHKVSNFTKDFPQLFNLLGTLDKHDYLRRNYITLR